MEDLNDKDTGHVLRRLPVDLFQLGLVIREDEFTREQLEYIPLFDIETGEIVTLRKDSESLDWQELAAQLRYIAQRYRNIALYWDTINLLWD